MLTIVCGSALTAGVSTAATEEVVVSGTGIIATEVSPNWRLLRTEEGEGELRKIVVAAGLVFFWRAVAEATTEAETEDAEATEEVEAAEKVTAAEDEAGLPASSSSHSRSSSPLMSGADGSSSSSHSSSSSSSPPVPADADPDAASLPVRPPSTPAAKILAVASFSESHAMLVPGLLTRGRATHTVPLAHGVRAHLPPTHCAKDVSTQACSPSNRISRP